MTTFHRTKALLCCLTTAFFAYCSPAWGALVTYEFSGKMTSAEDAGFIGLRNGDIVQGRVTIDLAVVGIKENTSWDTGAVTERTRFVNPVTDLFIKVGENVQPVHTNGLVRSELQIHEGQHQVFPDASSSYFFDRYVLTVFDVSGFGQDQNLPFFQFDFASMNFVELPTLFAPGPFGSLIPNLAPLQPYQSGKDYARGRFALTPNILNVDFEVESFEVLNTSHIDEPSTIALFGLTLISLIAAARRKSQKANH